MGKTVMKKGTFLALVLALLLMVGAVGCSSQEPKEEEGAVDQITTKAAKEITDRVHSPIDKAKVLQSLGEERMDEMDKALNNQ